MRVLYDHQIFSLQLYGGVSRYFVELARGLADRADTELQILAPLYINSYLADLDPALVSGRQMSIAPVGTSRFLDVFNRFASRRRARQFAPDIVHETYFSDRPAVAGKGSRRVITVYDMIHERLPEYFPKEDRTADIKRRAIARADHVLCISEKTRTDLLDAIQLDPATVSTVHISYDAAQTHDAPGKSPIDGPYLLYVGHRDGYKNFSRVITAVGGDAELRSGFRLVCFGGPGMSTGELENAEKMGLRKDDLIWMRGDDSLLRRLYRGASAFVYPSLYEGFGIPPLEAMAESCPVVCSRGGSIPEVVGDAGEFFDPEESDDIADAIRKVVTSPSRSAELREAGLRRINEFSWAKCARKTHAVYSALV